MVRFDPSPSSSSPRPYYSPGRHGWHALQYGLQCSAIPSEVYTMQSGYSPGQRTRKLTNCLNERVILPWSSC